MMATLLELRCTGTYRGTDCDSLLQRVEEDALRPGKRLELKCRRCNAVNTVRGTEEPGVMERWTTRPERV